MRTLSGKYLVADLNDAEGAYVSASLPLAEISLINENLTVYTIFPYELNDVPIFTNNLYESSTPAIVSDRSYTPNRQNVMYRDDTNTVRVVVGTSFTLAVQARQPDVLNVENGVPIIKPANADLIYQWFADGQDVLDLELARSGFGNIVAEPTLDKRTVYQNTLNFTNVTKRIDGSYTCVVSNDIGQTTSETITIEVLDPTQPGDPFNAFYRTNAIQNGFATDSTNNWTAIIGEAATKPMLSKDQEVKAKEPNAAIFGHAAGEVYPHPINIRANSIRGFQPASLLQKGASYFTRGPIDYIVNGGTNQVAIYQDIDLTEITDYISGRAYGSKGVRAYFGCVIGNAITRYIPTLDILGPDERNISEFYYSNAPRISYENFVLAGPAFLEEMVTVTLQEYEGATPLQSTIYENGQEQQVNMIQITDTLSTLMNQKDLFTEPVQPPVATVKTGEGDVIALPTIQGEQARVLNIFDTLYPNREEYYAHGQYAEYKDLIISRLNSRTNKVRITIKFDISTTRMNEISPDVVSNELGDLEVWRKPYIKLLFKEYRSNVLTVFQQNQSSQYKDRPLNEQIKAGSTSHGMATCLGLIMEPILPTSNDISGFKRGIVDAIPKEIEERPAPINAFTSEITFTEAATNIKGLSTILDIQGDVGIRFYRKFENAGWWGFRDEQRNNHDEDNINGRIQITDITTDTVLYDTLTYTPNGTTSIGEGTDQPFASANFPGNHTIRIRVEAFGGDGWKKKVYPYLSVRLANELSEYTGEVNPSGNLVHLWPARINQYPQPTSKFVDNTTNTAIGRPSSTLKMGMYPAVGYNESVRKFEVDIPSNQIAEIFAGVRFWSEIPSYNNENTTEEVVSAKIDFGPNGLEYFRVPKL